ncbi:long-chain-acyl-CoA synthetase [Kutzneria buriramensis]|uniref:long-chain-acyl-CoA synthetase n=1 Tax=Kutzneria buriramensis TaxID=1045776 RepID=UPI001FE28970|nr:long-chain-acyl-CoA synthetase [Kutzneria buriramensis]
MNVTEQSAAHRIGLAEVVRALPGLALDAPSLLHGAIGLVTIGPTSRDSVGHVFQRVAHRHPERPFLRFEDTELSYGQANLWVNRYAAVLNAHGVRPGRTVGILAENRPETLLAVLAVVKLGATAGMLNHHQRGDVLNHSQKLLDSTVLVVGSECREALESLPSEEIRGKVLCLPDGDDALPGYLDMDEAAISADDHDPVQTPLIHARDKAFYIFTSGTTGLPKASSMSHFRWLKAMTGLGHLGVRLTSGDTLYCCLPLYHNNALTVSLSSVLGAGATLALGRNFSASRFWDDIERTRATAFCYIGELCRYLLNQPVRPNERTHRVRVVVGNGLRPEIWDEFTQRFGIGRVAEFYGASECNLAFINALNIERTAGLCPLPYAVVAFDADTGQPSRDAGGHLRRVGAGQIGLLITKVTDRAPFDGYTDQDASERKLVRNGFRRGDCWFNTGDLVRDQGWSHVAFVDRLGDTFRWKGENVATTEVEGALDEWPAIEQAVVYGVEVPGADGKAGMAAIKLRAELDGPALARHLADRLPGYAIPLFLRVIDEVEQTSTFKSRKVALREQGYAGDGPVYVLTENGYVPRYDEYAGEVAAGRVRV